MKLDYSLMRNILTYLELFVLQNGSQLHFFESILIFWFEG